jgi:tRNA A-37 threonylcarbamoyl transferase component Bud32
MTGDRLGKWVIFKELGRGGMGRVYLAQEELTGRQAALKVLAAELAQEIGFLQRFQREIETLSKLEHPNIVQFYEPGYENGLYFYAMEYVDGQNLDQVLAAEGKLSWQEVLDIALQVAPAIRHVHDHGIIHRDLKPSNLLRTTTGKIKLTDFGIAKVFASTHLTATGGIVGTAEFLSPEQAAGKIVGRRSDLYCFGCVLYMLLTGQPPFAGKTYVELLHKHRYGQFDRPKALVPAIPHEIDELICQLLEKDPDKRPRDALVFLKQLENLRNKLERKSSQTQVDQRDRATLAENRTDKMSSADLPEPATLLARLVRAGLRERHGGGPVSHFFNRPWVLVFLLVGCIGLLAWGLWPLGQDELYARGAALMETGALIDMKRAWTEYLDPLETRYPDHPYQEKVAAYKLRWETAQSPEPTEAQRIFRRGELQKQQGNLAAADQTWRNLIAVFDEVPAEKEWVLRARRSLNELEKAHRSQDRWKSVRAALDEARKFHERGQDADAERILTGIEQLYHDDPTATDILVEVRNARQNHAKKAAP